MIYSDAQSEAATEVGDDEYETLTVSEAPLDEKRYDEEMDLMEERQTLEKIKGTWKYSSRLCFTFLHFIIMLQKQNWMPNSLTKLIRHWTCWLNCVSRNTVDLLLLEQVLGIQRKIYQATMDEYSSLKTLNVPANAQSGNKKKSMELW